MTPFLLVALFGFLGWLTQRLHKQLRVSAGATCSVFLLLAVLLAWGLLNSVLSLRGVYASPQFFERLPGYWLPFVPVVVTLVGVLGSAKLREALCAIVDYTPPSWLIYVHAARMLAIGTIIKAANGEFPPLFAYLVGGPDLLFGISAAYIGWRAARHGLGRHALMLWHAVGAAVILVPLLLLMPVFMNEPLFHALFVFPMVLAPSLIVPTLVMLNLLVVWRLLANPSSRRGA